MRRCYYSNDIKGDAKVWNFMLNRERDDHWYGWMSLSWSQSERDQFAHRPNPHFIQLRYAVGFNPRAIINLHDAWSAGFRFSATKWRGKYQNNRRAGKPNFPGRYVPVYGGSLSRPPTDLFAFGSCAWNTKPNFGVTR